MMRSIPDHPVIRHMERDGQLPRRGALYSCQGCGCDICHGERFYRIDDDVFCYGCDSAALRAHTYIAGVRED